MFTNSVFPSELVIPCHFVSFSICFSHTDGSIIYAAIKRKLMQSNDNSSFSVCSLAWFSLYTLVWLPHAKLFGTSFSVLSRRCCTFTIVPVTGFTTALKPKDFVMICKQFPMLCIDRGIILKNKHLFKFYFDKIR